MNMTENKENTPMFGYKVTIESYRTHYEHDGKQYGAWSASSHHTLGRKVVNCTDYPDVVSSLDIPSGTNALVVWAIWGSGDSFGFEDGANSEAIGIFTDMKAASELVDYINNMRRSNSIDLVTSDGQHHKHDWCGWSGYFERLESVNTDVVTVF